MGVGGIATCASCGMKYTQERVQEKVQHVRGTVTIDNTQMAANYLELAEHALEARNLDEAEVYANKLVELDPTDYQGWLVKARAAGWQSTLQNLRLREAAIAFARAIDNAPSEVSEGVREFAASQMGSLAVALIKTRGSVYVDYPSPDQAAGFKRDLTEILEATRGLLERTGTSASVIWEDIATSINNSVVQAWSDTIQKDYRSERYPSEFAFDLFRERIPPAIQLMETAIGLSSEDDAADIIRYQNIILFAENLRDAKSYQYTVNGYVVSSTLTKEAQAVNNRRIAQCRQAIASLEKADRERKEATQRALADARRELYWSSPENREEHARLTTRQQELAVQLEALRAEERAIPGRDELAAVVARISALNAQLDGMNLFKRSERKALQDKIRAEEAIRDGLQARIAQEQGDLSPRIDAAKTELSSVTTELTKPR